MDRFRHPLTRALQAGVAAVIAALALAIGAGVGEPESAAGAVVGLVVMGVGLAGLIFAPLLLLAALVSAIQVLNAPELPDFD